MRCLNHCPEKAIEAAHGMGVVFYILITVVNTQIVLLLINILKIKPEVWWWKLFDQVLYLGSIIIIPALLYIVFHFAMGFKPVRYLIRFTSLTTLPFWRRYNFNKLHKKNSAG